MKKCIPSLMLILVGLCSSFVQAEEKTKPPMTKESMAAKKMMMVPETMAAAKKSMMSDKSMVPGMVAKEMVQQEMMHDKEVMSMVEKGTMTKPTDDRMMMSDKHVAAATEKMLADPNAMQMLFQELVARHIATQKMELMMKKPDAKMGSMTGKGMKSMVMDKEAMMMAKKEMMSSEDSAMMMAHETLIHSLMQDEEVMAVVAKEAMMHSDPKMASMMSAEKMKMADEMMMKDKAKMKGMMNETMVRGMVDGQHKMMMKDEKKK